MRLTTLALAVAITHGVTSSRALGQAAARDSSGTVVALVSAIEDGRRLPFSVVSVPSLVREQFTNDSGVATLANLPAGRMTVRVRHIGYSPVDAPVVVHAGRVDTLRVQMRHIIVSLGVVRVRANALCTSPGPPRAGSDPAFIAVFEQLRENAEQYRLLAESYPFSYTMERESYVHYVGGDSVIERLDTISVGTGLRWHYAPGDVVVESGSSFNRQVIFNLPALIHFAERSFLDNHCFANGGVDTIGGKAVLRVDFAAASRIRDPDVDGSMYLDPVSFQIVRSILRLTRIPEQTPEIATVDATTDFAEIYPSISLASEIRSTHALWTDRTRPVLPDVQHEIQRLLRVTFEKGKPGDGDR